MQRYLLEAPSASQAPVPKGLVLVLCAMSVALSLFVATAPPNWDVAWLLLVTERVLRGEILGTDIIELNPPLILILQSPAVWLSQATGVDYYLAFCFLAGIPKVIAASAAYRLSIHLNTPEVQSACLSILILLVLFLLPANDFGQRDVLALEFLLPFLFLEVGTACTGVATKRGYRFAVAILAAIALMLKPFLVLAPAVAVCIAAFKFRSLGYLFRAEYLLIGALGLFYIVGVIVLWPDWVRLINITNRVYFAYSISPKEMLTVVLLDIPKILLCGAVILPLLDEKERQCSGSWACILLFVLAISLYASPVVQMKGWSYHFRPAHIMLVLALGFALPRLLRDSRDRTRRIALALLAGSLLLIPLLGESVARYGTRDSRQGGGLHDIIAQSRSSPLLIISDEIGSSFPAVVELGAIWASRGPTQWIVPATLLLNRGDSTQQQQARELRDIATRHIVDDLKRWGPKVVAVQLRRFYAIRDQFDWIEYYSHDPDFREIWNEYRIESQTEDWAVYRRLED